MKTHLLLLILTSSVAMFAADPVPAPAGTETPPAAAPPQRSPADLEKLVAPIALYPDPLLATILPASVYPLEIVQAARFVKDTNNLAQLDAQPWDANVKAAARVPEVIQKMSDELSWTMELGEAFLAQDKAVLDAIQRLRGKAQTVGTLQTSAQQVVTVTNVVVEKTIEQQVVVVTNTVVQIQPADPQVVYVPQYNPTVVYAPPPAYVANPYPLLTFGAGMAVGAIIANNCDWHHGGCYSSSYHGDVNVNINNNLNVNANRNANINSSRSAQANSAGGQKWQPDQSRLSKSGSPNAAASARSGEARGWGSGGASGASAGARPSAAQASARPSTAQASARPSTAQASARPSAAAPSGGRAAASPAASPNASRSGAAPSASQARPSPSPSSGAFSGAGGGGGDARTASSRGASSRGGSSGGGRSGGRR